MDDAKLLSGPKKLSFRVKFCYGVGHILNDLCASMWFSYLLIFLHKVVKFSNVMAGTLLLIGQVVDALSTPLVGIESDRTGNCKYGRRKIWHLIGVVCVALSFPFIFNLCISCASGHPSVGALFIYYTPFIMIFQFGWASTQISHLALIPELTNDEEEKVFLNAIRYGFTVASNILTFSVVWIFLHSVAGGSTKVSADDASAFMYVVFVLLGVGLLFMLIFHVGIHEPFRTCSHEMASSGNMRSSSSWKVWFKKFQFYQVAFLYMSTRLVVNISQIYLPMYVTDTLKLKKEYIAVMPLIVYTSGFFTTFIAKPLNQSLGRKVTFFLGLMVIFGVCVSFMFLSDKNPHVQMYMFGSSIGLGIGGSTMLITALAIIADLIGENKETGAFVYGAMSFVDKLSNGIAVQLIQIEHPCSGSVVCCGSCNKYYKIIMSCVVGGAAVLALLSLLTMFKTQIGHFKKASKMKTCAAQRSPLHNDSSVSTTISRSCGPSQHGPRIPYEPGVNSVYGSIECKNSQNGLNRNSHNALPCQNIRS